MSTQPDGDRLEHRMRVLEKRAAQAWRVVAVFASLGVALIFTSQFVPEPGRLVLPLAGSALLVTLATAFLAMDARWKAYEAALQLHMLESPAEPRD